MKVIFLQNIAKTGNKGQIKDVSDGFARNYLLPNKLARPVTANSLEVVEKVKEKKEKMADKKIKEVQGLAKKMAGTFLPISSKANESGTLFAAIDEKIVAEKLSIKFKTAITSKQIVIEKAIKNIGQHRVKITFSQGISAEVIVVVSGN
jgi:large subunit ribosomal protein L9